MRRESRAKRSARLRPAMFAAFALVLGVLGIGLTEFMGITGFTSHVREAPTAAPVASHPTAAPLVPVARKEPLITPDKPQASPARLEGEEQAKQESSAILPTPAPVAPKAPSTQPGPSAQAASSVARAPEQS